MLKDFYKFDILTQLSLIDMFDNSVNNTIVAKYIVDDLNLYENVKLNINHKFRS